MPDRPQDAVTALLADFTARQPARTGSLIVTVFGDVILPRGGEVLLADLITLLEGFGLNDSQVRTALSRLVAEGWLEAERLGRRSLYRPTATGRHRIEEATRRIYGGPPTQWRGDWHIIVLPNRGAARKELEKDLGWLGFGSLAAGVMLHPTPDPASLATVIGDLPLAARPLVIAGDAAPPVPPDLLHTLVQRCWDLDALSEGYRHFLAEFAALDRALAEGFSPEPLPALLARLMLIHDYRRRVLRDPMLPARLLPGDWIGGEAYALARRLYRKLARRSERWVDHHLHAAAGPLPRPKTSIAARFA